MQQMLGKCGIIPAEDVEKIVAGLETILADIEPVILVLKWL